MGEVSGSSRRISSRCSTINEEERSTVGMGSDGGGKEV